MHLKSWRIEYEGIKKISICVTYVFNMYHNPIYRCNIYTYTNYVDNNW